MSKRPQRKTLQPGRLFCEVLGAWKGKVTIRAQGFGIRCLPATLSVIETIKEVGTLHAFLTLQPAIGVGLIVTDVE